MLTAVWLGIALQIFSFVLSILRIKILSDHFSVDQFGLITIYFSVISFLSVILIFNTDRHAFRSAAESGQNAKATLRPLLLLPILTGPLSAVYFYFDPKFSDYALLATTNVIVVGAFHLFRFYFLGIGESMKYSALSFLMTNLWFITLIGMVLAGNQINVHSALWLMLGSHAFLLLVSYYWSGGLKAEGSLSSRSADGLLGAIRYSIGFLPIIISTRILELGDKYIVHAMLSALDMGLLVMANSIVAAVVAMLSVLSDLYRPYFSRAVTVEKSEQLYRKFIAIGFIAVFSACLVFLPYGDWLFSALISRDYSSAAPLAMALLPGCFIYFLAQFYVNILEREKASGMIAKAYAIGSCVFLVLTFPLVGYFGIWGAVIANYIGNFIILALLAHSRWRYILPMVKKLAAMGIAAASVIVLALACEGTVKAIVVGMFLVFSAIAAHLVFRRTAAVVSSTNMA